jgi:ribosomal protein L37E
MSKARKPDSLHARTRQEWRDWLDANGAGERRVLLEIYHKASGVPSVGYREAVLSTRCVSAGSTAWRCRMTIGASCTFHPRRPGSTWSKANPERAEQLIAEGLMRPAGQAAIDEAKASGAAGARRA